MNYTLIKFQPIKEVDDYFKRVLLKVCQLYPFYKDDILPITREIQQYRKLLKSKEPSTLNPNNIINSLKRFDEVLTTFYNKEDIARRIYLKQLKIISKLLEEPFKEEEYKDIPFGKLYLMNKEKYEQLTPENKDIFFDVYTSNKKVKPVMEILDLWLSLKDKKLRNVIREEINEFKGSLKQDVFKDTQKDIKEYITKTNEQLQKSIRQETKEIIEGGPVDKLRFLISQTFNIEGNEGRISNELLSQLKKYKELKEKYKPLINKYENAREDDKFNIRREIEEALYEIKPIYEFCKEGMKTFQNKINTYDKKYELTKLIERIETLNDDKLNYLYQEFAKHSSLFNKSDRIKYQDIINDRYNKIFKSNIEDELFKSVKNTYKNFNETEKRPKINSKGNYGGHLMKEIKDGIRYIISDFNYDDKNNELFNKYSSKEMIDRVRFEIEDEERERKAKEDEAKEQKQKEEEAQKQIEEQAQQAQQAQQEQPEQQENNSAEVIEGEEVEEGQEGNGIKGFGCIKDINMKTITKILEEINNKYGNEEYNKLDSIIYYNLKQRYPNKTDDKFNEFFIKNLKKFDKKYKYDKYKSYMKDKKYTKKYISSLTKGGFLLGPIISIGKKLLGLNDEVMKGNGIISSLLSTIGLNDKILKDKNIKGCGILSKLLGFIGLSDDVFDKDELLIKIKPFIDLLKKEKDKNKVDSYLYAICKLEFDDDNEEELRDKYYSLLYNYDNLYRKDLFNKRIKKDFYNNKGSFSPMLLGIIPGAIQGISSLISSISNAVRGKSDKTLKKTSKELKGGKIMTLQELEELKNEIK